MHASATFLRLVWIIGLLAVSSCRDTANFPPNLFPATVGDQWTRTDLRELPVSEAPDPVPRTAVTRLESASYKSSGKGPDEVNARVYILNSDTMGIELAQRWRPSADTIFFNHGRYFVVVKWQSAERAALQNFVRELETRLGGATSPVRQR